MKILHYFPLFIRRPGNVMAFAALAELLPAYNPRPALRGLLRLESPLSFRARHASIGARGAIRPPPAFIVFSIQWHPALLLRPPPIHQPAFQAFPGEAPSFSARGSRSSPRRRSTSTLRCGSPRVFSASPTAGSLPIHRLHWSLIQLPPPRYQDRSGGTSTPHRVSTYGFAGAWGGSSCWPQSAWWHAGCSPWRRRRGCRPSRTPSSNSLHGSVSRRRGRPPPSLQALVSLTGANPTRGAMPLTPSPMPFIAATQPGMTMQTISPPQEHRLGGCLSA